MFTLVIVTSDGPSKKAEVVEVAHGHNCIGKNVVAVLEGRLCKTRCTWCQDIKARCSSRRVF